MKIVSVSECDSARWDSYVTSHPDASPYHRWAYKQTLEKAYGLKTSYKMAIDEDASVAGVFPAAEIPGFRRRVGYCSLPYCDRGEPLANSSFATDKLIAAMLNNSQKDIEIRATHPENNSEADRVLGEAKVPKKVRLILDLPEQAEELFAGFKSKLRSQINKARKNQLSANIGNSQDYVDAFYKVFTQNMRSLGSPTHSREWFLSLAHHFSTDCLIGIVTLDGKPVAGGVMLKNGLRATIPWAATLRDYNKLSPNMLLYWSLLEASCDAGCSSFDFGRSTPNEGTYRFKTQWGARPIPLNWKVLSTSGTVEYLNDRPGNLSKYRPLLESLWSHLPLPVTVSLGSKIRPWISL